MKTACPGICGKGGKKKSHIALSRSLSVSVSSLPLRTDRSFDSGSKFTLQTCWEAGEHSDGKAFLHFKDPERLPDSLSEIPRLIINLLLHSCGCETSAEALGWRRELEETNLRQLVGPTYFHTGSNFSNGEGTAKNKIDHHYNFFTNNKLYVLFYRILSNKCSRKLFSKHMLQAEQLLTSLIINSVQLSSIRAVASKCFIL